MSLFITFEGGEGSGKSYQAKVLYRRLMELDIPTVLTHEPGATPLGEKITRWLKWGRDINISPMAELLLFNASRAQLVAEVIRPALAAGKMVICDRYADSTAAYQSYGRGLDLARVLVVNSAATQGALPNLTILMDVPVEVGLTRKKGKRPDRFEQENLAFHRRVREGYLTLAKSEPKRWLIVDATQSKAKIAEVIWKKVGKLLAKSGNRGV